MAPHFSPSEGLVPGRAERLRRRSAPLVALLSGCLAMVCLASFADVVTEVGGLAAVNARFVGWAGVGGLTSTAIAISALLASPRLGSGLPLATGVAAAVFGLALGRSVGDDAQLALALVMLGFGIGGLLGGAACMPVELPPRWREATLAGFALPMVAGPPVIGWLTMHFPAGDDLRLTLHPPVWPLAVVSAVIVSWSALTLLLKPSKDRAASERLWDSAWTSLVVVAFVATVAVMLLGFEPDIRPLWLRPLVLVSAALVVVGLALTSFAVPSAAARLGYVAVAVVGLCWPACVSLLLLTADAGASRVSALAMTVVAAAACCGAALGAWRPGTGVVGGLLVVAIASAGAWLMPGQPWSMVAAAGPLAAGAGAALLGGLRSASRDVTGVRFVGAATVSALVLGSLIAVPLSWALGGSVPNLEEEARAAGRVLLGSTFALAVLTAAYASTLVRQLNSGASAAGRPRLSVR